MGKISPFDIFSATYSNSMRWIHFFLPITLVAAFISGTANLHFTGDITGQGDANLVVGDFAGFWVSLAWLMAIFIALFTLVLSIFDRLMEGHGDWLRSGLLRGFRRLLPSVIGYVIYMVAVIVGSVLLLIPGLMILFLLYMMPMLIVIDGHGPIAAVKASWTMVWGNAWRLVGASLLVFLPIIIVYMLVGMVIGITSLDTTTPLVTSWASLQSWVWLLLTAIGWTIMVPFYLVAFDALKKAAAQSEETAV